MDNLSNTIYLVERIEISPDNDDKLYSMDYYKIMSILNNISYHTNLDELTKKKKLINKDFKFSKDLNFILKNNDAYEYLKLNNYRSDYSIILNQNLIPIDYINYYLINYNKDNYSYFIIVISIDIDKLDNNFYDNFSLSNSNKNNKLFVSYLLTMMKYHFEEINNLRNGSSENSLISKLISENTINYMSDKMIEQPNFSKTKLFEYQKANIYWMLSRENDNKNIILDETMIVNWGPKLEFNFSNLKFEKKRNQDNVSSDKLNKFLGGCLCDDVGLGKTIQVYTLCLNKLTNNIIIVPEHLYTHWVDEFKKHFSLEINENVINNNGYKTYITTYLNYSSIQNIKFIEFDRIIVDEYHELVNNYKQIYEQIKKINSKYKWAITATPFVNKEMIYNIVNFIAKYPINSKNISKYKMYINTFTDMFRKNVKRTIEKELKLPKIKELVYYLDFSDKERLYYDTLLNTDTVKLQETKRFFCINPSLYFTENFAENNFVEINLMDDKIKNIHKEQYDKEYNVLINMKKESIIKLMETCYLLEDEINKLLDKFNLDKDKEEVINNTFEVLLEKKIFVNQFVNKYESQVQLLDKIKKNMVYFEEQLKEINDSMTIENKDSEIKYIKLELDKDCGICLGEIDEKFTILQCGHMYCTECINTIMNTNVKNCPTCKLHLKNTVIYTIDNTNKKSPVIDLVNLYGTKIANLINICNKLKDKTVLFSYTPTLLTNIQKILNLNNIKSILIDKTNIDEIKNFKKNDAKVLILSSDFNASGLNIICAKNIIILEPLQKDYMYRKQIENQIIGRLHRIGQDKEINFIRLIIKDSIEHDIDKENKINNALYSNKEFDLDLEKVEFS